MLAEHFIGSMDNGADFTSGWDKPSWEWDNVVMLSNRKAQAGDWTEEPLLVTPASGIPGVSASSGSGSMHKSFSDRNSTYAADGKLMPGFSSSPVKQEKMTQAEIAKGPGLNLEARSDAEHKVNEKICNSGASHQKDFLLGLGGGAAHDNKAEQPGAGDAETGLKLGLKRSFTPDSTLTSSNSNTNTTATTTTTTITTTNNNTATNKSSPGKKPRGSANHVPRCQVEGCKTDLSSAKDYHRRHKVCAMHSKSAKVSVNSIEQRFCQQCSRFHVLAEFDEGKRSCRRRLAGHNERRRKPQPDPMALTSAALAPYQAGFMRLARDERLFGYGTPLSYLGLDNLHGKMNWPRFGNIDEHGGAFLSASSSLCRPERFFMLFPQRKAPGGGGGAVNGMSMQQAASGAMGQNLSLSSSSPGPGVYTGLGPTQGVTGISDPGRALSLLSSQAWAASPSMEQLMSEKQRASSYSQASYSSGAASQPPASLALVPLEATSQGQGSYMPLGVNNYENNSVLTLLQESEFRALPDQHARPTIDLMQMSTQSPQAAPTTVVIQQQPPGQVSSNSPGNNGSNHNNASNNNSNPPSHNNNSGGHLADFQVFKPYNSTTIYDSHQL